MTLFGTGPETTLDRQHRRMHRRTRIIAVIALIFALLSFVLRSLNATQSSITPTASASPSFCEDGSPGPIGPEGQSAYELWLAAGNTGSVDDFLESLVGTPGICTEGETGPTGATGPAGATGASGPVGASGTGYYGSFYDVTDQFLISANTPQAWTFSNVSELNNGVTITSNGSANSRIKFPEVGVYNISFSTVYSKNNSSAGEVDIWFRENGIDIPNSNTVITIAGQAQTLVALNYFYSCTDPNNYVEIMWWTSDSNTVHVDHIEAKTSPTRPLMPSIILTVNQVG